MLGYFSKSRSNVLENSPKQTYANVQHNSLPNRNQREAEEEEGLSKLITSEGQMTLYSKLWLSGERGPLLICIKVVGKVFSVML